MASFMRRPHYSWEKILTVPTELEDWVGGAHKKDQKNLHLLGIETQFLGTPACNPDNLEENKVIKTPQVYKILADSVEKKRDHKRHRRDSILLKYDMKLWTELNCL